MRRCRRVRRPEWHFANAGVASVRLVVRDRFRHSRRQLHKVPTCNTEAMNLHLAEIAEIVAPGAHAVLMVDQAGWHLSTHLVVPPNITIIALPPKSPELNPVENVWQFMRDNWLSNRVFKSYDDLVDHCCQAWNKLVDQPWRIMSIGLRQWAHGF